MLREHSDPYAVLGVAPTASQAEITHAYRTLLRSLHPDTRDGAPAGAGDARLQQVLSAYALLRNPALRAEYDRAARPVMAAASTNPQGRVNIPVNHRRTRRRPSAPKRPPLWVGPVRRHRD